MRRWSPGMVAIDPIEVSGGVVAVVSTAGRRIYSVARGLNGGHAARVAWSAVTRSPEILRRNSRMINTIIDMYHGNSIDFEETLEGGIVAIIHKATEGANFSDSKYHARRERAKELGFLWGAYHFSTGGSVSDQVENFLSYATPEDDDLISLDWEPSDGPDMTLDQARHFAQMIKDETGRWPLIYGGHLLRESIGHNPD